MYNSLSNLPYIPYRIMTYLATDPMAEDLWKLLKYADYDALSKPNLTFEQKMDLVWQRQQPQKDYSVFLTNVVEDAIPESRCIIKCYQYYIHANELYNSTVVYAFDCLYGPNMALVEYNGVPVSRGDLFIHLILNTLNGKEVSGIGKLIFLDDMSRYDLARSTIGNSKTFTGVQLFMSTIVGDTGVVETCGD